MSTGELVLEEKVSPGSLSILSLPHAIIRLDLGPFIPT